MTAVETYVRMLRRRLWMSRALRVERCEEITAHLLEREGSQGRPFVTASEITSLMGTRGVLAFELNAAVPWWLSRMPFRLLLAPIVLLLAGDAAIYAGWNLLFTPYGHGSDINVGRFQGAGLLLESGPIFLQYTIPVAVALYARRLCVRPLHAVVAISVPLLLSLISNAGCFFRPGEHSWQYDMECYSGTLAAAMQCGALAWAARCRSTGAWKGAGLILALPVLPVLGSQMLYAEVPALPDWPATIYVPMMGFAACAILIPAAVFQRIAGRSAARRNAVPTVSHSMA